MGFLNIRSLLNTSLRLYNTETSSVIMKYLNVAEKNDAAKNIAAILSRGASNRREGLSPYNKIYEFGGTVFGQQAEMVMTSVSGHLLNYAFIPSFKNWNGCNPSALFDAPIIKRCPEDYERIKKTLEREIRSCHGLIIWTDCDREGENIGFEIIKVCTDIKPNLRIYRAKFSEITGASIFRALNTLGQPDKNISDAVDVRMELDLRTGAAFTRLQTLRLQKVFPQKLSDKLISYGSCQFPTLGFVVERYQAIEDFVAEPFWRIKMSHTPKDLTTDFAWKRDRLFDKNACEAILDVCKENPQATVESVESKPKSKWRPLPLDTVEMEKNVSRKLKINAKDAMKIAEKLYTQGYISYPRTETNIFPKELNLVNLVEQQREDNRWGPFAQRILQEGGPNPRQGRKSDQAHPPIHPTKYANNLQGNEQRLYEFIVRHFLACVHKDAQGFETTVIADISDEKFTAKGLIILERNYLDVYIYEKWNTKEINNYQQGDRFMPTILDLVESSTQPPKLLTEADLIALMEKHGIGTDATHAEHIDKIKTREYVGLHENMYFVPGTLGMGLVEGYNSIGLEISLAKPNLRAEFENDLKMICDGLKDPEIVRREQVEKYRAVFQTVAERMRLIDESLATRLDDRPQEFQGNNGNPDEFRPALKCPKCGNDMIVRSRKNGLGKYIGCLGFPDCKNAIWLPASIDEVEVLNDHCQRCGSTTKLLKMTFKQNPFPGEPNPNILCIGGCSLNVLETFGISLSSVRPNNFNEESNRQTNANNSRENNRQTAVSNSNSQPNNRQNNLNNWLGNGGNSFSDSGSNSYSNNTTARVNSVNQSYQRNTNNQGNNSSWLSKDFANTGTSNTPRLNLDLLPGPSGSTNRSAGNSTGNSTRPDGTVVCGCNAEAIQLTVRKDGNNKGRKFYKCGNNSACDFFMWVPDDGNHPPQNQNSASNGADDASNLQCDCHQAVVTRTVNKDGPNKGRQFFVCAKPMGQSCKFFKWCDEVDQNNGGGGGDDWGGGGGGGASNWGGNNSNWRGGKTTRGRGTRGSNNRAAPYKNQTRAKRKCGICGQEGHTRANCPN